MATRNGNRETRRHMGPYALVLLVALLASFVVACGDAGSSGSPQLVLEQAGTPIANGGSFAFPGTAKDPISPPPSGPIDQTFTIRNVGDATLSLGGATPVQRISGDPHFSVLSLPPVDALDPGSTADFVLRLEYLSGQGEGGKSAVISVSNDDPNAASFSFTVTGTVAFS